MNCIKNSQQQEAEEQYICLEQYGYNKKYYFSNRGNLYNIKSEKFLKLYHNYFSLTDAENKPKKAGLKKLYKTVFNINYCLDEIENLPNEEWRQLTNIDSDYYVSSAGRIKSTKGYKARIIKPIKTTKGYERITINRKSYFISKLVIIAFYDNIDLTNKQIHHKDLNRQNNSLDNLTILTTEQHILLHKEIRQQEKSND